MKTSLINFFYHLIKFLILYRILQLYKKPLILQIDENYLEKNFIKLKKRKNDVIKITHFTNKILRLINHIILNCPVLSRIFRRWLSGGLVGKGEMVSILVKLKPQTTVGPR